MLINEAKPSLPMRLNDDCCGVMDNGCFHYGSCTSINE